MGTLILDHHLLRDMEGVAWLERLTQETGRRVLCSADFMRRPRMFLEADREQLYADMPVSGGWHEQYGKTRAGGDVYWERAKKLYKAYRLEEFGG